MLSPSIKPDHFGIDSFWCQTAQRAPRRVALLLDGPLVKRGAARYEIPTGHSLAVAEWVNRGDAAVGLVRLERTRNSL